MAAVLTPKSLSFPYDLLHDARDTPAYFIMNRTSPPRPSLPSISSLIHDVDRQAESRMSRSPPGEQRTKSAGSQGRQPPTPERWAMMSSSYSGMPPSPSLPGTSSFDFLAGQSPGAASRLGNGSARNGHAPHSPATTNPEAYASQKSAYPPIPDAHPTTAPNSPNSSRRASEESSQLSNRNIAKSESSYPDPAETRSSFSGLARQRPLPVNFPPSLPSPTQSHNPLDPQMGGAQFQHHHHYPVSNSSQYAPSTDRYQCPTCQKAFSRPSSLKIHTYSHTGEKPFKCKHEGCGKYFSVRSNMKRHEKGCHGVDTSSNGGNSPQALQSL